MEKILERKENYIANLSICLICLLPVSLVLGPLIAEINLFIVVVFFIFEISKEKNFVFLKSKIFLALSLLWIYFVLMSLISSYVLFSLKSSFFYLRIILFSIAICYFFLKKNFNISKFFFYSLFLSLIFLFFDATIQKVFGVNLFGQVSRVHRISSFFGDELILGSFIARLLPTIFAIFYFFNIKKIISFLPIVWLYSILIVIFSGEKTSFALIILSSLIIIIFSHLSLLKKILGFISLITLIFSIFYLIPDLQHRIIKEYIKNTGGGKYLYSKPHNHHFNTAYKMFLDKPTTGHGPRNFRKLCSKEKFYSGTFSCSTHPHNIYIQLLAETGFVPFFTVLMLFFFTCYKFIVIQKFKFLVNDDYNKYYFRLFSNLGLFINLFPLSTSGNFFNNWFSILMIFVFSFFIISNNIE
tara:strand:+ start:124 stop:1362 length:1239 start_codon:yes stop_codon:yes gene_type:complete